MIFGHGVARGVIFYTVEIILDLTLSPQTQTSVKYLFNFGYTGYTAAPTPLHGCSRSLLLSLFSVAIGRMRPQRDERLPSPRRKQGVGSSEHSAYNKDPHYYHYHYYKKKKKKKKKKKPTGHTLF